MNQHQTLRVEHDQNGVVTITIDRQEVHNALDRATMRAFASTVSELALPFQEHGVSPTRAIIITGAGGKAFCSGGDQDDLEHATSEEDGAWLAATMGDALHKLEQLPVPVIAAIEGHALGGGAEIALACDIRIVSEHARVGLVHRRLALIPGWGGGQRLLRLAGYARAMDMLLAARPLSGQELAALGLANIVAPPGEALKTARSLAERLATFDPSTVSATKSLLRDGLDLPYDEALAAERARFPGLWAGQAHLDAIRAFHDGTSRAGRDVANPDATDAPETDRPRPDTTD